MRQPSPYSRAADSGQWQQHCDGGACRWPGFSLFNFSGPGNTPGLHVKLHALQLAFERGHGKETRTYVAADFMETTVKD